MTTLITLTLIALALGLSIAAGALFFGLLAAMMAAFAHRRVAWGVASFFLPPLAALYAGCHRQESDWAWRLIVKSALGLVVLLVVGLLFVSMGLGVSPWTLLSGDAGQQLLLPKP